MIKTPLCHFLKLPFNKSFKGNDQVQLNDLVGPTSTTYIMHGWSEKGIMKKYYFSYNTWYLLPSPAHEHEGHYTSFIRNK